MLTRKRIAILSGIFVASCWMAVGCGTGNSVVPQAPVAGTVGGVGSCYTSPYSTGYSNGYGNSYGNGYAVNGGCQTGYILSGTMCCPNGYNSGYGYSNGYNNGYSNGYGNSGCPYPTTYYPNYGCR
jgi:hypothetical protein